jgi:hypothetical protein
VLFHEGQFHMFRNGFKSWPAVSSVAHHVSDDGLTWPDSRDPIFSHEDVEFPAANALVSSAHVEDDGTWVLYFYSLEALSGPGVGIIRIGRATAASPDGPSPDPPRPWNLGRPRLGRHECLLAQRNQDGGQIRDVLFRRGGSGARAAVGMATSPDGITWTRYDDPATTEAPYAESDPVFTQGEPGAWDDVVVHQPRVILTPDGYVMLYRSHNGSARNIGFGIATSDDGITWTRHPDNPALLTEDVPGARALWFSALAYADGTYYFYVEVGSGRGTDIWVATHEGSLAP